MPKARLLRLLLFVLWSRAATPMRLVLQRVKSASVTVNSAVISSIGHGVLALVGLHETDTPDDLKYCAKKLCASKLWANENDKPWRKSVKQMDYELLLVSQFTLLADCRQGNRPSFTKAADPEEAAPLVELVVERLRNQHGVRVETGRFGADMKVALLNDGPVTIILDSMVDRQNS